ncbi:MAG: hypothetical protein ABSF77_11570 [Spirochaetia bacterium]
MARPAKLFSARDGAYMCRLELSTFRSKVSILGIKGTKKGRSVFYTRQQLEDVHSGISAKKGKATKKTKKITKSKRIVKGKRKGTQ